MVLIAWARFTCAPMSPPARSTPAALSISAPCFFRSSGLLVTFCRNAAAGEVVDLHRVLERQAAERRDLRRDRRDAYVPLRGEALARGRAGTARPRPRSRRRASATSTYFPQPAHRPHGATSATRNANGCHRPHSADAQQDRSRTRRSPGPSAWASCGRNAGRPATAGARWGPFAPCQASCRHSLESRAGSGFAGFFRGRADRPIPVDMTSRTGGLRLFGWYVLASAIPIALLGVGLAHQYRTQMDRRALDQAVSEADAIANAGIEPILNGRDLDRPLGASRTGRPRGDDPPAPRVAAASCGSACATATASWCSTPRTRTGAGPASPTTKPKKPPPAR